MPIILCNSVFISCQDTVQRTSSHAVDISWEMGKLWHVPEMIRRISDETNQNLTPAALRNSKTKQKKFQGFFILKFPFDFEWIAIGSWLVFFCATVFLCKAYQPLMKIRA